VIFFFHINDIVYLTGEITNGQTTGSIILSLHPIFNSHFVFHKNVEINVVEIIHMIKQFFY